MVDGTGKTVCVTGVSGYVGSFVAKTALDAGFTVRGTCRSVERLAPAIKEALDGVEFFEADLLAGSEGFEKAFEGCDYVLHLAAPFFLESDDCEKDFLDPMIKGFDNVWTAAKNAGIKKVVYTSSSACVQGTIVPADYNEAYPDPLNEARWNVMSGPHNDPYAYAKTMAERHAWVTYYGRNPETDPKMVTINPGLILGPPMSKETCGSSTSMKMVIGAYLGVFTELANTPPFKIPAVDIRNVAQAQLAALSPEAKGRHLLVSDKAYDIVELFATVSDEYPDNKFPKEVMPITGSSFDNSKAKNDLGIEFIPMGKTLKDTIEALKGFGVIE